MPRRILPEIKVGDKFGYLEILELITKNDDRHKWNRVYAVCRCKCGKTKEIPRSGLLCRKRPTLSCGCRAFENIGTHKLSGKKIYTAWADMMRRCYNPKHKHYSYYGGRGIVVCDEWHDPVAFYEYAIKLDRIPDGATDVPKGLSLDRIDSDGIYRPGNVRWATWDEQMRNTSQNVWIEINGERRIFADWCRIFNINKSTVRARIKKGWGYELALSTPAGPQFGGRKKKAGGVIDAPR